MKTIVFLFVSFIIILTSCELNNEKMEKSTLLFPSGKWRSISFFDGNIWQGEIMPHYLELKKDGTYSFHDQNSISCSGNFTQELVDDMIKVKFQNSECGLTTRILERESSNYDTIELSVVSPPNITHDRVRYVNENPHIGKWIWKKSIGGIAGNDLQPKNGEEIRLMFILPVFSTYLISYLNLIYLDFYNKAEVKYYKI
jgi:hypothetical protein